MIQKLLAIVFACCIGKTAIAQQPFIGVVTYELVNSVENINDTTNVKVFFAAHFIQIETKHKTINEPRKTWFDWKGGYQYDLLSQEQTIILKPIVIEGMKLLDTKAGNTDTTILGKAAILYEYEPDGYNRVKIYCDTSKRLSIPKRYNAAKDIMPFSASGYLPVYFEFITMKGKLIWMTTTNITPLPLTDSILTFPPGYRIMEESERQRISDSLLTEFKAIDSQLIRSNKALDKQKQPLPPPPAKNSHKKTTPIRKPKQSLHKP